MHEVSCRVITGYLARCASTLERGIQPLLVYSSDHYVRGYYRIVKGGSRADAAMKELGYLVLDPPRAPVTCYGLDGISRSGDGRSVIGPIWLGDLEHTFLLEEALARLRSGTGPAVFLSTTREMEVMMSRALGEHGLPPCGYDLNMLASNLRVSPPAIGKVIASLNEGGHRASRTRFSHTILRTDAPFVSVESTFRELGRAGG
jgi:tRNA (guanine26-N2/guanine27-N2)-dimethyltransferase